MNLLIGWNAWSVLEFLMTGENVENTCWRYRSGYYVGFKPPWLAEPFEDYKGQRIDKVFIPSSLSEEDYRFVDSLGAEEIFYLEEGEYDYVKYKDDDKHLRIPFYTMNPDEIANPEVFSEIRKLTLTPEIIDKYISLYDVWMPEDKYDVILYTDPMELDFGTPNVKEIVSDYMDKYHKGARILVKAHPRDKTDWCWDTCSYRVPAQLLLHRNAIHVFMYRTTVLRYIGETQKIEMINLI